MGDTNIAVENAFVMCDKNASCCAKCYRGYIFPSGYTEESYRYMNGVWKPIASACKRIPVISVDYDALWTFEDVQPSSCYNIAMQLNNSVDVIEKEFCNICQEFPLNATAMFTYSMVDSEIIGRFKVDYYNFSSWFHIETCIAFKTISFENKQIYKSLFDNVTCGKENMELRYSIRGNLYNISIHLHCDNTSEVHNVTRSTDGKVELYCDSNEFGSSIQKVTTETAFWTTKAIYIATSSIGGFLLPVIGILLACCIKRLKTPKRPSGEKEISCKCNVTLQGFKDDFRGELIENELYQSADNMI
nr:uncharacterized protein LOC117691283 [Crassostrea gigas]